MHAEMSCVKYRNFFLVQGGLKLSCIVFVSMAPTLLNENLISRYKSPVAFLYIKPPKEAELCRFKTKKKSIFQLTQLQKQTFKQRTRENRKKQVVKKIKLVRKN